MAEDSVSKIIRPVVKESFTRKWLIALLDGMRASPIIWVSGPAGCGKTTLSASYFSQLKPSTVLVLDNYQFIPEESGFHDVIHQGLSSLPENFHIILISRSAPPPAWARLQANGKMGFLGWNELRLSLEETTRIIRLRADQIKPREVGGAPAHALSGAFQAPIFCRLQGTLYPEDG